MPSDDERRLIFDAQEGSRGAFRLIVERYMKQAYDIAYGVVGDHDEAEDVAQESFVRVYRSLRSFRGDAGFGTWLYRIVMNVSLNRLRKRKTKEQREVKMQAQYREKPGPDLLNVEQPDLRVHIERALHQLPTLQRAVVILRHMNGMSTREVGAILGCSDGTVKTHLHRGLKKMRTKLGFLKVEGF